MKAIIKGRHRRVITRLCRTLLQRLLPAFAENTKLPSLSFYAEGFRARILSKAMNASIQGRR
jgi:hypothetical protein